MPFGNDRLREVLMRGMTRVIARGVGEAHGRAATRVRALNTAQSERGGRYRVREEIVDIHRFLSKWISGACTGDEATYRKGLARRLSKNFVLVTPLGKTFAGEAFTRMMRGNHGSDPTLQIDIRNVEVRHREDGIVVVTFEAWQDGPVEGRPVGAAPPGRGRVCTVVMKDRRDRFEFLHVHETWLPDDLVSFGAGRGEPRKEV